MLLLDKSRRSYQGVFKVDILILGKLKKFWNGLILTNGLKFDNDLVPEYSFLSMISCDAILSVFSFSSSSFC